MSDELALARNAIAGVPFLEGYAGPIVRLGGLTNLVFQVGEHCIRVPGKGTPAIALRANASSSLMNSPDSLPFLAFDRSTESVAWL